MTNASERVIIEKPHFELIIKRLAHQLVEEYGQLEDSCIIGLQPRGIYLAECLRRILLEDLRIPKIEFGKLDITFYRDDFRRGGKILEAHVTDINFLVEKKNVILVDDVLYTGRTVQAGLTALNHYGRPKQVDLLVLIDRRFVRHLPIEASFTGMQIDALDREYVHVEWQEDYQSGEVLLYPSKEVYKMTNSIKE